MKIGCSIPNLESRIGICVYSYITLVLDIHVGGQKLINKKSVPMTVTIPRPTRTIVSAAVMALAITVPVSLGLHVQILCLQFVYIILNHLKISTRFELAGEIWHRIFGSQNGFGRNLKDSFNNYTTKVAMSVSQDEPQQ
jgi:hypothetical protein